MISPYLELEPRTFEQVADEFDHTAKKIRWQTHQTIIVFRRGNIPVWTQNYTLDCLRFARRAHSKAILNREAYKQAINEREIQRALFKGAHE